MKKKSTKNTIHNKKYQCFSVYWYKKDGCILSKLHQSIKGINRLNIPNAFLRKISGTAVAYAENNIHIPFYWQIRQIFKSFFSPTTPKFPSSATLCQMVLFYLFIFRISSSNFSKSLNIKWCDLIVLTSFSYRRLKTGKIIL